MGKPSEISFFLNFEPNPPTVTHQERKVRVAGGRPVFYMTPALKSARVLLTAKLAPFAPKAPWSGPVGLSVLWVFRSRRADCGVFEWRTARPDTDNLQKMLKDVMTACGFWKDDALVCSEYVEKVYAPRGERHGVLVQLSNPLEDDAHA